jgi:hypothetical protein
VAIENWNQDFSSPATMQLYADLIGYIRRQGFQMLMVAVSQRIGYIMKTSQAKSLTNGVSALIQLPQNSVNYCFFNKMLEDIPNDDLLGSGFDVVLQQKR